MHRETASADLKAAGVGVRRSGSSRRPRDPNPAIQVSIDPGADRTSASWATRGRRTPCASACEPYRESIVLAVGRGRGAFAIYRDPVDRPEIWAT